MTVIISYSDRRNLREIARRMVQLAVGDPNMLSFQ